MVEPDAVVMSWRIRDVALDLPGTRQEIGPATNDATPTLSSKFDVDTCIARLRRDKASVVRGSFEAAASCVLQGLYKERGDGGDIESVNEDLPEELEDIPALEDVRKACMRRAHNNKDPSKRKNTESGGARRGAVKGKVPKKTEASPKFTRNTPASSAAALDSRLTSSRAILCAAANVAFSSLTPPLPGVTIEMADIPQNPNNSESKTSVSNMGEVIVEAQTLGTRIAAVATNAARRASRRYMYRKDNIRYGTKNGSQSPTSIFQVSNPFAWKDPDEESLRESTTTYKKHTYDPEEAAVTNTWLETCLPRFMKILHTGVGHAIYHDTDWKTRHGRVANLLGELAAKSNSFGPHLIVTVEPDVERFAKEFRAVDSHLRLMSLVDTELLRAMEYSGSMMERSHLRTRFTDASGLAEASFHVIITSYTNFLKDYAHFCQVPFETVIVDGGFSLLAASQANGNSQLCTLWESGFFSKSDHQMGLAGTNLNDWNFLATDIETSMLKEAWIGLTAQHRILTTHSCINAHDKADPLPITGLVNFTMPHFADSAKEEWDRSRISNDPASMQHFQKLLAHCMVVYSPKDANRPMLELALDSLAGQLVADEQASDPVPEVIPDIVFVDNGKVAPSRRSALQWLGKPEESWLRYELGNVSFQSMLNAMKVSTTHGHLCEEIVTASSTTTTGATGQVAGTLAYRPAVRCCRQFGSEQGLRQHLSAMHAPPGTWLCRTCGSDCVTSQARTHHERTCGQPNSFSNTDDIKDPSKSSSARVGKASGPPAVVGKKKGTKAQTQPVGNEKDTDGSLRVPGYRGVWVNQAGKHFVKINGERLMDDTGKELLFPAVEDAAKQHDEALKAKNPTGKTEFNFKPDGTRIVYEDAATSSSTGIGGAAANVVPLLSVINIKDLPPDVKPLLRDPRQTSRTGGNSKRHIYAYRGVCRQTRKGHDRWQSQISFMGVNHYLGTYDSEWDAASVYAWAHKLLYGVEATLQAQKEGEEAAAAYEKEKRDFAAGIVPATSQKVEKKKNKPGRKPKEIESGGESTKKRSIKESTGAPAKKKPKAILDKESLAPIFAKSASRAVALAPRNAFADLNDTELASSMARRLIAAKGLQYAITDVPVPVRVPSDFCPCIPVESQANKVKGGAMLLGISPRNFGWTTETCLASHEFNSEDKAQEANEALELEYGKNGRNETFKTLVQGTLAILGCASFRTQRVYASFGMGSPPLGGAVGSIDCHIGGKPSSCSESAAAIRYIPTSASGFQFSALCSDDLVTLNGKRVTPGMGGFPLFNEDVCTVGPRVFIFVLPSDT